MTFGMLIDTTKCIGCDECVVACKKENNLKKDRPRRWKKRFDDLSSTRYTTVIQRGDKFVRQFCRHCLSPACASACIVGALERTEEGAVIYDNDKCMGCRYCMMACPFGIPRYDWEASVPFVRKCTFCYPRIKKGDKPACAEACQEGAVIFGQREALLQQAKETIENDPKRYIDKVYGETEVGGTAIIYISDVPLDFLAWKPDVGDTPLPDLTYAALSKVPPIVLSMAGLMGGIAWVTHRRMKRQQEAAAGSPTNKENTDSAATETIEDASDKGEAQ